MLLQCTHCSPRPLFCLDRDFALQNPVLAHGERKRRDEAGRKLGGAPVVSEAYVKKELEALAQDMSPEDAARTAREWLLANGARYARAVRATAADRERLAPHSLMDGDGVPKASPAEIAAGLMREQVVAVKSLIRERSAGRRAVQPQLYRSFLSPDDVRRIQKRELGADGESALPIWASSPLAATPATTPTSARPAHPAGPRAPKQRRPPAQADRKSSRAE
jgi:hypothetical protein